jgi:hypothetical protein
MRLLLTEIFVVTMFLSSCLPNTGKMYVEHRKSDISEITQSYPFVQDAPVRSDIKYLNSKESQQLRDLNPSLLINGLDLQVKALSIRQQSENGKCMLKVDQMEIHGLRNKDLQTKINRVLATIPQQTITYFQKMNSKNLSSSSNPCRTSESKNRKVEFFTGKCSVPYAQGELLSLNCHEYYTGGAYPITYNRSMTFNLNTGEIYAFADLFKEKVNFQQVVGEVLIKGYLPPNPPDNDFTKRFKNLSPEESFYLSSHCEQDKGDYSKLSSQESNSCIVITNFFTSGPFKHGRYVVPLKQVEQILNPEIAKIIQPQSRKSKL